MIIRIMCVHAYCPNWYRYMRRFRLSTNIMKPGVWGKCRRGWKTDRTEASVGELLGLTHTNTNPELADAD
jgi:hypothetical protein